MKPLVRILPLIVSAAAYGQDATITALRSLYEGQAANIVAATEKLRDADLDFRPSHDVMSMRAILAHVGDTNYSICSSLKGEKNPMATGLEKVTVSKEELVAALKESYGYCNAVLGGMKDANLAETYKSGPTTRTKAWNALHLLEHMTMHYGNIITYMRIRGMVPPETERRIRNQKK